MTPTAELQSAIESLPPLPQVAMRVLQIVNEPDFAIGDLVAVVRTDPTLTARLLKLCNSSMYALPQEVQTVAQAVGLLGTRTLVKLVVATCTQRYYKHVDAGWRDRPGTIWRHSVCCGIAAQTIATSTKVADGGASFTAGILHNIGKVVLSRLVGGDEDSQPAEQARNDGDHLQVERALAGMDHAAAGGLIADRWFLPVDLRRAIKHHHDAEQILADNPLTAVVHLADLLALQIGCGGTDAFAHAVAPQALERLQLADTDLDVMRLHIIDEVRRSKELLKL